jgi:hypothetical protein
MNNHSEENKISKDKNVLVVLNNSQEINAELQYIIDHFCGTVVHELSPELDHQKIYICGNLEIIQKDHHFLHIIKEFSVNFENISEEKSKVIQIGEVPVIVSNAGVFPKNFS